MNFSATVRSARSVLISVMYRVWPFDVTKLFRNPQGNWRRAISHKTTSVCKWRPGSRREPDCRAVRVLSRVDWITPRLNRRDFLIIRAADRLPTTKLVRIRTESAGTLIAYFKFLWADRVPECRH